MCYANPLWMGWNESEGNKKECSWKNLEEEGGMKGLLCHLFPFHSSSVAIEEKKVVVNWSALPFKSVIQII